MLREPSHAIATDTEAWRAIQARRALLREQLERAAARLPWLSDPSLIPDTAIVPFVEDGEVELAAFSLAAWMLMETVRVADDVNQQLAWREAFERYRVPYGMQDPVVRSILLPAARHAPGLFAMAEIVSVVPALAHRAAIPRDRWGAVLAASLPLVRQLAFGNTVMQVLLRCYLGRAAASGETRGVRSLDPARLRLDDAGGLTTATPIEALLHAARRAAERSGYHYVAPCVAMAAHLAGEGVGPAKGSVFDAFWTVWTIASDRLLFCRYDPSRAPACSEAETDPDFGDALDAIAAKRLEMHGAIAADPYPEDVALVLSALLESRRGD